MKHSPRQLEQLEMFRNLLWAENQNFNLIAFKDPEQLELLGILDSLSLSQVLSPFEGVLDFGTGGGLPGIPLAISYPEKKFILLDSKKKKVSFLKKLVGTLGLENVHVQWGRVEESPELSNENTVFIAKAVAPLPRMFEWFSRAGKFPKYLYLLKGPSFQKEWEEIPSLLKKRAPYSHFKKFEYELPEKMGTRWVLMFHGEQ